MQETPQPRWHWYPFGLAASLLRPLVLCMDSLARISALFVPVFIFVSYLASLGVFGLGQAGQEWHAWADIGASAAFYGLLAASFVGEVARAVQAAATAKMLTRGPLAGITPWKVPHPGQWQLASGWLPGGLLLSGFALTAALVFARMLPFELGYLAEGRALASSSRAVGIAVIAIAVTALVRPRVNKKLKVMERAWPVKVRDQLEEAGDLEGQRSLAGPPAPVMFLAHRKLISQYGDWLIMPGAVIAVVAVLAAVVGVPIGLWKAGSGPAAVHQGWFIAPLALAASAAVLLIVGTVLRGIGYLVEIAEVDRASDPQAGPPAAGIHARVASRRKTPLCSVAAMVAAIAIAVGAPAWIGSEVGEIQHGGVGIALVVIGALVLVAAFVGEWWGGRHIRMLANVVLARWPLPGLRTLVAVQSSPRERGEKDKGWRPF